MYHLTAREIGGKASFPTTRTGGAMFAECVARFGWVCHACCLMDNDYHFVVETPLPNLARACAS